MIAIFVISLLLTESICKNICDQNNGNPRVSVGVRFGKYTVLTTGSAVFRIENFRFNGQTFSYGEITDLTKEWMQPNVPSIGSYPIEELFTFPMLYTREGNTTKRIVHIIKEKNEADDRFPGIEQLFSYATLHTESLTAIIDDDRRSLLLYKFRPEVANTSRHDPLTLVNMFAKFPNGAIYHHMKAILAFPLNRPELPTRFFIYYSEPPLDTNRKPQFKRHIMIGHKLGYGIDDEMDWRHDIPSGKCIKEQFKEFIVEAAFALTDYSSSGSDGYTFEIIEFVSDHYFVRRVEVTADRVNPNLEVLKVGSIGSLFGCKTSMADKPSWYSARLKVKKARPNRATLVILLSLFCLFLVILMALLIYLSIVLKRQDFRIERTNFFGQ